MTSLRRKTVSVVLAGALGCTLGVGGVAAVSYAPDAGSEPLSIVKVAQAKSSGSKSAKAKKAYRSFLSGTGFTWGYSSRMDEAANPSTYRFALADINGDRVPELFVENMSTYYAAGYARVYSYQKGKVKLALTFSAPPERIYTRGHVLYYRDQHTGSYWGRYFKLSKGELKYKAGWSGTDMPSGKFHYSGYTVNGKSVSRAKYNKYVKKLLKNSKKSVTFDYHQNTSGNRARYL